MRVTLNGPIVADDDAWIYQYFGYQVISPLAVRQAVRDNPAGEDLVLEINSGGGSVFSGFEIYSILRGAEDIHTRAEVQSLAASAASTIMLGCDEVWASPVAQIMIHNPSTWTEGDQQEHRGSIRVLDSITESILNGYEAKCAGRRTRDQLRSMMARTTWMSAQEALDAGLVDGILWQEDESNAIPANIVNAVGGGIRSLAGSAGCLPDIRELRARYEAQRGGQAHPAEPEATTASTGGAPEAHIRDWRAEARLSLEKIRFGGMKHE